MHTVDDPVAHYLDASTVAPASAELIWVFGTRRPEPAHIAADLYLRGIAPLVVVTKWYHSHRVLMTLRRHLPAGISYYAVTYEPAGIGRGDWRRTEEGRRAVLKEAEAIPRYLARDHLAPVVGDSTGYCQPAHRSASSTFAL